MKLKLKLKTENAFNRDQFWIEGNHEPDNDDKIIF